jgi:hypothetical protein
MPNLLAALAVLPLYGFLSFSALTALAGISRELDQQSCRMEAAASLLSGATCQTRGI